MSFEITQLIVLRLKNKPYKLNQEWTCICYKLILNWISSHPPPNPRIGYSLNDVGVWVRYRVQKRCGFCCYIISTLLINSQNQILILVNTFSQPVHQHIRAIFLATAWKWFGTAFFCNAISSFQLVWDFLVVTHSSFIQMLLASLF